MMQQPMQQQPDRAPPLLAIVRIIAVLGMAFFIAGGLFLLLWWKPLAAIVAFLLALPFLFVMRYMEKRAARGDI
jgi:CHASE2 domain-containing sensor protein